MVEHFDRLKPCHLPTVTDKEVKHLLPTWLKIPSLLHYPHQEPPWTLFNLTPWTQAEVLGNRSFPLLTLELPIQAAFGKLCSVVALVATPLNLTTVLFVMVLLSATEPRTVPS